MVTLCTVFSTTAPRAIERQRRVRRGSSLVLICTPRPGFLLFPPRALLALEAKWLDAEEAAQASEAARAPTSYKLQATSYKLQATSYKL